MAKYLVTYHAPAEAFAGMADMTEEQKLAGMKPWQEWMAKVGPQLIDGGSPLMGGANMSGGVGNGWTASSRKVTGYSILEADNMDAAKALLDGHPHLQWHAGCEVEVHEMAPMM